MYKEHVSKKLQKKERNPTKMIVHMHSYLYT